MVSPFGNRANSRRLRDLVIVGILPRSYPQWAAPHCTPEMALAMTADEELPWENLPMFWSDDNGNRIN
jgi:hypothetical protein